MEKYKICPECGAHNPPGRLECLECEMDLSGVRVVDEAIGNESSNCSPKERTMPTDNMVRVCEECGASNPVNARKCMQCHEDISYIVPTPAGDCCCNAEQFVLKALDDNFEFVLKDKNTVVGRTNVMQEYLKNKAYVSRRHAEFLLDDNKLYIKNYSLTNFTFINNNKITGDDFVEVHAGDIIGLGGKEVSGKRQQNAAYFLIGVE